MMPVTVSRLGLLLAICSLGSVPLHADTVYASIYDNQNVEGSILKIDDTGTATTFATGFEQPEGIAFDSNRDLLVLDGEHIYKVDSAGTTHSFIDDTRLSAQPGTGIAIDQSGNIYAPGIATDFTPTINKYDSSGQFVAAWNTGSSLSQGMVVDSSGELIVALAGVNTVISLDTATFGPSSTFSYVLNESQTLNGLVGLTLNSTGKVFVTGIQQGEEGSEDVGKVYSITSEGMLEEYTSVIGCECTTGNGIIFDSLGNLLMANGDTDGDDNSITKTTPPGGDANTSILTPLSDVQFPNYLAIEPAVVPEPGVTGLLLAGLGFLVVFLRRRMTKLA